MRALVTGGAGFIGSHLVERLSIEGHQVVVYDNLTSGKRSNLDFGPLVKAIDIVEGDVRDAPQLDFYAAECDVIFHEAAIVSVPYSVEHPQETHDVNVQGTMNVLQAARRQKVKRVVFASSAAVYGQEPTLPKTESMRLEPVSPYGVEKASSEFYLATWSELFGVETVALRYFNVFGPRQDPSSPYSGVISIFATRAMAGKKPTIYGDGEQSRDFVYVSNVVDANMLAATKSGVSGKVFNVGAGKRTTLNELCAAIGKITAREFSAEHQPARAGDIVHSYADISRARTELGYEPKVSAEDGLKMLIESLES
ncbi:MAG: SDR family oxidoreductase [Polyangiaceae bacterium]